MNWKKHKLPALLMLMIVVYSCASMGTPDGGPYDEEPPKFIRSSPKPYATNNKNKLREIREGFIFYLLGIKVFIKKN